MQHMQQIRRMWFGKVELPSEHSGRDVQQSVSNTHVKARKESGLKQGFESYKVGSGNKGMGMEPQGEMKV